jgi:four helix bundle protein
MATLHSFEELDCWKEAVAFRREIRKRTRLFPADEKYRLADQVVRSSRSVTANIAEGFGKFHFQHNIRFCRDSRGSLFETLDHLILAHEEGYITEQELIEYRRQFEKCLSKLNGYIKYLETAKVNEATAKSRVAKKSSQPQSQQPTTNNQQLTTNN